MNTVVLLPLNESMLQRGAGKHEQWLGYMTVLVVNHGITKSISMVTTVIRPMIKLYFVTLQDCFGQKVKLTLAIP